MYLLEYYQEIKTDKPIDFVEIDCWCKLTGTSLNNFEIKAIRAIDRIQQKVLND